MRRPAESELGVPPLPGLGASTDHEDGDMAAMMSPEPSRDGDEESGAQRGLPHVALPHLPRMRAPFRRSPGGDGERADRTSPLLFGWTPGRLGGTIASTRWRPTPFAAAVAAMVLVIAFVAGLTYYGARTFTRRATNERAANEAQSFTVQSTKLANNDAFDAYVQILRYADDPVLNNKDAPAAQRVAVMQQYLYLYVNKFSSLSIATRSGDVLATTDPVIRSVRDDQAFIETRANLNPANSGIVIPTPGAPGFISYATPLHQADGAVWGMLVARADPNRLWGATLAATIDGGRNVIINSDGLFGAGVPNELTGQAWQGSPLSNGGVRASIAGVDSICGLALIGKGTQIDKGMNLASCMPVSLIQSEQGRAMGKQGMVTIAAAILASVLATGALKLMWREPQDGAVLAGDEGVSALSDEPWAPPAPAPAPWRPEPPAEPALTSHAESVVDVEDEPAVVPAVTEAQPPPIVADVDALTLIDAYEGRNARLAERLRETIQARLLVAASQADEAYRLTATDAEAAKALHRRALDGLERVRTLELRALGQELHPGLVRMGLPAALKALGKEFADSIAITLEIDATTDSLVTTPGRSMLPPALRLALFRLAVDTVRGLAAADASSCVIELARRGGTIVLSVSAAVGTAPESLVEEDLAADVLAIEAHGGNVSTSRLGTSLVVTASIASPPIADMPEGWVPPEAFSEDDDELPGTRMPGDEDDGVDLSTIDAAPLPIRTFTPPGGQQAAHETDAGGQEGVSPLRNLHVVASSESQGEPPAGPTGTVPIAEIHLGNALEEMSMTPRSMSVTLDLDLVDGGETLVPGLRATVVGLIDAVVAQLEAAGAARCTISVRQATGEVMLSVISETDGSPFDAAPLRPFEAEIEAFGGYLVVSGRNNAISITAAAAAVTLAGSLASADGFEDLLDGEGAPPDDAEAAS
jgi:hypothetical protein